MSLLPHLSLLSLFQNEIWWENSMIPYTCPSLHNHSLKRVRLGQLGITNRAITSNPSSFKPLSENRRGAQIGCKIHTKYDYSRKNCNFFTLGLSLPCCSKYSLAITQSSSLDRLIELMYTWPPLIVALSSKSGLWLIFSKWKVKEMRSKKEN